MGAAARTDEQKWYLHIDGQNAGPYSLDELKAQIAEGRFKSQTPVWADGMAGWDKACNVEETRGLFGAGAPPARPSAGPPKIKADEPIKADEVGELSALIHVRGQDFQKEDSTTSIDAEQLRKARRLAAKVERVAERAARDAADEEEVEPASRLVRWVVIGAPISIALFLAGGFATGTLSFSGIGASLTGIGDQLMADIPPIEDVSGEDYRRLDAAAKAKLETDGPRIEIAISTATPAQPVVIVGTNLPEGINLVVEVVSTPGKVMAEQPVKARVPLSITKHVGRSKPIVPGGNASAELPVGEYEALVFEDENQVPPIAAALAALPASQHPAAVQGGPAQGRKAVFSHKFFVGDPNTDFSRRPQSVQSPPPAAAPAVTVEGARAEAARELSEGRTAQGRLTAALELTWNTVTQVRQMPPSSHAQGWAAFKAAGWAAAQGSEPTQKEAKYHVDLLPQIRDAWVEVRKLNEIQSELFPAGAPATPAVTAAVLGRAVEAKARAQAHIAKLSAYLDQGEKKLADPAYTPAPGGK